MQEVHIRDGDIIRPSVGHSYRNSMTLIMWVVGKHNNHIYRKGEETENKILFVLPSIKDSIGHGGPFLGNRYVLGLLDWTYF
jgi:hypothetical protein